MCNCLNSISKLTLVSGMWAQHCKLLINVLVSSSYRLISKFLLISTTGWLRIFIHVNEMKWNWLPQCWKKLLDCCVNCQVEWEKKGNLSIVRSDVSLTYCRSSQKVCSSTKPGPPSILDWPLVCFKIIKKHWHKTVFNSPTGIFELSSALHPFEPLTLLT